MSLFNIFEVSGSAMSAQSVRLNTTASNLGYHLLDRHFRKDVVISEFLVVENPTDMR